MNNHINFNTWINNIKETLQGTNSITEEPIIVIDDYPRWITEQLIKQEHERKIHIHDLDAYFDLQEKNLRKWKHLQEVLSLWYKQEYQYEVLKEIALSKLFKTYKIEEICYMIREHEGKSGEPL